jgi:hypothetical protein
LENDRLNNPLPATAADDDATGFPGLPKWWMVYSFVGFIALYVVLLTLLTELYR